ncbi:PQQ-binding-like beta-propeller repeat protein [Yoonia sp. R2331]|uniref:PQQ-like beta-propeller repeat protein n=1 Tax=Yoonia sp. R2331 TaxID=3237238 RepID=UPI0034E439AD
MIAKTKFAACFSLSFLIACGEPDVILPGTREAIRPGDGVNTTAPIALPATRLNANWTHRNGEADHTITHPALSGLNQIFAVNIGEGDSRKARITADPVVANGVIYTLDSRARVTATATSGAPVWVADVQPGNDNRTDASGGGLAYGNGRLFVTSGFGEVTALDAASGGTLWTQDLDAPGTSAPTVSGDLLYVVGRDSTAWAIEVSNGRVRWQQSGTPSVSAFAGGAGPAVAGDLAIFPFDSGEVVATFPQGGLRRWSTAVSGARTGTAGALVSDIGGDPVIDGDRVYVGNVAGRTAAIDAFSGERIWTANDGAVSPVWPVGNAVFLVNDINELVRLDAATGTAVWRTQLPQFEEGGVFRQRRSVYAHYGPVLAGGRLIVASSDGQVRAFDPRSGALVGNAALPGGAASHPAVAGGTLYVVTKAGQLVAFR